MREGSLSWLYTAWLIVILLAVNDVKSVSPTVVSPTVASPTVASPTVASPTVAPPTVTPPTVTPNTVASPTVPSPTVASSTVATTTVAPITATPLPSNVTIVGVKPVNSTSLEVTWNALKSEIRAYAVCYGRSSPVNCSFNKTVDGNTTSTNVTGLNEFTEYYVAVKASSTSGYGLLGAEFSATTEEDKPAEGPTIENITSSARSLKITWNKLSSDDSNGQITKYEVFYQLGSTVSNSSANKTLIGVDNTMVDLTGLKPATNYTVAVRAFTTIGPGPLGETMTKSTSESVPKKGPNITSIIPSATSLKVTWSELSSDDSNGEITKYEVCYQLGSTVSNCSSNETLTGVDNTMVKLTGLKPATMYTVAVRAFTKIGPGLLGETLSQMTNESEPMKGPTIKNITSSATSLKVTWNKLSSDDANGNITKYEVFYQLGSTVSNFSANKTETGGKITMVDLTGLKPATMYTVAVRAFTKIGPGPLGDPLSQTTSESAPENGATVTNVSPLKSTVLRIKWEKLQNGTNGNITRYRVCYDAGQNSSLKQCKNNTDVIGADNTTFNLTGLNEATLYYVAVQAGTQAGFGPIGNIVNNKTLQDKPSRGPGVTSVTSKNSTSILVSWGEMSPDYANGEITKYRVCYKPIASSEELCKLSEHVDKNVRRKTISGLTPYTSYVVAVKASTVIGFGPPGTNMTAQTLEAAPDPPRIDKTFKTVTLTSITLRWSVPSPTNGEILMYEVCWRRSPNDDKSCKEVSKLQTQTEIPDLKPGTTYEVSVVASTKGGDGLPDSVSRTTDESALENVSIKPSSAGVSDAKTQIGFKLPSIPPEELGQIKYFYVIVKQWPGNGDTKKLRAYPQNELTNFQNSNNGEKEYIAIKQNGYQNDDTIIVGDNTVTAARRKRRNTVEYKNGPLSEDTTYAIFIRTFYDENGKSFQSSDIFIKKTEKTEDPGDGTDTALIVIVVVVIIVAILVVIFGVLLVRRRKSQPEYDGMPLTTPAKPVIRYPIPIAEFRAHCDRLGVHQGLGYQEEYENVRPNGQVTTETAKRQENVDKNRYNNIHAYDDTRVILSQLEGEEGSDYINANHIDGFERKNQFIAAQGALKTTIVDFWRMIWEQKVSSIVMVANPIEKGREKLAVYWPQDRAVKHGPFMIKLDGEVELADYVIRKMTVTQDDVKETRQITQFHYTVWPDHGVPLYTTSLQAFLTRIRKFVKDESHPVVVHCSAGVGRTGTFIGIFAMLDMIEATKTVDIFNFVCQMRTQRTHMVQVESQYVFLHKAVLEAIECGDTEINAPDLRVKMIQFNRNDPDNPDETLMAKQFKVLEKYTYIKSNNEEGKKSYNVDKNRNKDILPYEDTRVALLKSPGVDGSDYINASCIDSYQVRGMYIATQFPLESTVNEFWRMIWEKKSNCIIMLADTEENPELFKKYWTDKSNDAMLCGNLLVTLDNEEKNDEFVVRNFKLKKNEGGETRDIWHFNFLSWTEDTVPKTTVGIRQMIGKMQEVQRQVGNNPIVVHCSDGSGRTGAFCALVTSLERVKQDQSFNLFQTIMLQRIQRPRMVASVEQYKFCFQAILDFLDSFDQYANFQDLRQ